MEEWKDINGMDGYYQISNLGNVKSFITTSQSKSKIGKMLKPRYTSRKYTFVTLFNKHYRLHRLVAEHFIPNPDNLPVVNHKDGNKSNNNFCNLEWVTIRQNVSYHYDNKDKTGIRITKAKNYLVGIYHNKKQVYLGTFSTVEEAVSVRQKYIQENNII